MFSGIVEEMATVVSMKRNGENVDITLECRFADELKIDQSVSHNGVCGHKGRQIYGYGNERDAALLKSRAA